MQMVKNNQHRNEIVLNRMFAGSFLDDHIGHEIVNLYKDDQGRNYVYIQPYGTFSREHQARIEHVLLVRGVEGKHSVQVLGLATGLKDLYDSSLSAEAMWKAHEQYIRKQGISYNGTSVLDIFDRKLEKADTQPVYFSMTAERVLRPNRPVYLVYGDDNPIVDKTAVVYNLKAGQPKCSLKQYFCKENGAQDYDTLTSLIERKDLWTVDTEIVKENASQELQEDSFWTMCAIEDYELAWSSAYAYLMRKYPHLVVEFAQEHLGLKVKPFGIVERETDNIDILLENDEQIVVVENKITSKINGVEVRDNKLVASQLAKYYIKAVERACQRKAKDYSEFAELERRCPKRISCYVLTPNYNPIYLPEYDTPLYKDDKRSPMFRCEEHYRQIFYGDVYRFLEKRCPDDLYFREFMKGMKKHINEYHDDLFSVTKEKFVRQIQRIKTSKK